jgi:hypothetical protein
MIHDAMTLKEVEDQLKAVAAKRGPVAKTLAMLDQEREQWLAVKTFILSKKSKRSTKDTFSNPKQTKGTGSTKDGRYFRSEGDTVDQVRLLYGNVQGLTNVEVARILNRKPKNTRRNCERLIKQGLAVRMGDVYALNAQGRKEWENSPLFCKRAANE